MNKFKTTIGLEVHVQLKTKSKMFCSCDNNSIDSKPNTLICPICLALPGTLPVANEKAIEMTIKTGLALGSEIPGESKFDRKHYFYPDLPKGYQISQYDQPLCKGGEVVIDGRVIRLNRIHLEEDAGKLVHPPNKKYSLVDLNRAGTPLMEIVSEPDIKSPAEAKKFLQELQILLRYLQVSDADMEKGQLRCDANISIQLGDKMSPIVEIKNLNSFRFVEQSLSYEEKRLCEDFENWPTGRKKITRGFNSEKCITYEQRAKEEAADYRYFPEPDLPPIIISRDFIKKIKSEMIELPKNKKERYISLGVRLDIAEKIVNNPKLADYLESSSEIKKEIAAFVSEEVLSIISKHNISFDVYKKRVPIIRIAELLNYVGSGLISKTVAKSVFHKMVESGKTPKEIIQESESAQISDSVELRPVIIEVIKSNSALVEKYKSGKTQLIGFFVGEVMKMTKGRANPQTLNKLLKEYLDGNSN